MWNKSLEVVFDVEKIFRNVKQRHEIMGKINTLSLNKNNNERIMKLYLKEYILRFPVIHNPEFKKFCNSFDIGTTSISYKEYLVFEKHCDSDPYDKENNNIICCRTGNRFFSVERVIPKSRHTYKDMPVQYHRFSVDVSIIN